MLSDYFIVWLQYWKLVIADNYGAEITSFHGLKFYGVGKSNLISPYMDIIKVECVY